MINKNEVKDDFEKIFSAFSKAVNLFDDESFNKVPFLESWTAGQVTQHLLLASGGFANALNAEITATERHADEFKSKIKDILLNYESKMKSPDFILPERKAYDKEDCLLQIAKIHDGVIKAINDLDLSETCMSFELPGLGHLTRYEAIYFIIYHTERHTHQLNEIHRFLKA